MAEENTERTRRRVLRALAGTSLAGGLAGCNALESDTSSTATATTTREDTSTPTATPDQPPTIETATATTQENGQALAYRIVARDDTSLQSVVVSYGNQQWSPDTIDGNTVDHRGEFTDLSEASAGGKVVYEVRDAAGQEARSSVDPDGQAPVLSTFHVEPTRNAGEIALTIESEDDVGLEQVALFLDGTPQLQRDVSGQTEATTDTTVDVSDAATVGEINTLAGALEDWNGNRTESDSDTYIRKFDILEDVNLNIGANYLLWMGENFDCLNGEYAPTTGEYGGLIPVANRHIDQMQGHGINNVIVNFNGTDSDRERLETFMQSQLAPEIEKRPIYSIKDYRWNPDSENPGFKNILKKDMNFLKEKMIEGKNTFNHEGRHVVNIWNASYLAWSDSYSEQVQNEWGSYEAFVSDIRSQLTVDGTKPYLIAGVTGGAGHSGIENSFEGLPTLLREFDATGTWTASGVMGSDNEANWDEVIPWVEQNYRGHLEFVGENDMDFVPVVFPGFNDRPNDCWGSDRYIPRVLEKFGEILQLADEYRTTDIIDIATFNDWTEGTHVEPGSFRGNHYGTDYVDVVKEFQQSS